MQQMKGMLVPARHDNARPAKESRRKNIWRQRLVNLVLIGVDMAVALVIWSVAYQVHSLWGEGPLSEVAIAAIVPSVALWIGLRAVMGLYPGYGLDRVEELRRHTYSVLATGATTATFAVAFQTGEQLSRLLLLMGFLGLLTLTPVARHFTKLALRAGRAWGKPVIIVSSGKAGGQVTDHLRQSWELGYDDVAVFDYRLSLADGSLEGLPQEETSLADVGSLARRQGVGTIIFAMPHTRREQLVPLVDWASTSFRHVMVIPNLGGITNSAVVARDLSGTFGVEIKYNLLNPWARFVKRLLDLLSTVLGGLLITPLILTIALLIKLDSPGPAFYGHKRLGAGSQHFNCWKFRTMHQDAEVLLEKCLRNDPLLQAEWEHNHKLRDDPRVTRVGRFLRKTSLDELPQLWNVLAGEMSLTGPRPIVDAEVTKYGEFYRLYERIRPGMSGLWQVSGRSATSYSERVRMDSYYVHNWSIWLDVVVLVLTVKSVLSSRGAF